MVLWYGQALIKAKIRLLSIILAIYPFLRSVISRTYGEVLGWFRFVSGEVIGRLKGKGPFELKLASLSLR